MASEDIELEVDGLRIVGQLYVPQGHGLEPSPALCLCHGIPAPVPHPPDDGYPLLAQRFCSEGFVVLFFNFRGTGTSGGNFDLPGWARDLAAAIDFLQHRPEVDKARLSVMGFSGGAAVSVYQAARDLRVSSLVTCACPARFSRLRGLGDLSQFLEQARRTGIVRDPDFPASLEEWAKGFQEVSAIRWIDRLAGRPLLIIHGDGDEVVPPSDARELYEKAGQPKQISMIQGAGHRIRTDQRAMSTALAWLKKVNRLDNG